MATAAPTEGVLGWADGDTVLAAGLVAILAVLVIPLPKIVIDLLITANLSFALLVLLVTIKAREPLEFSTFPSLLLFATLARLALNVASARLILLDGDAGNVIHAFGQFVVGGNVFVGGVIFLILIVVQFVVITKGAGRVSEVAARFTLDALPGKQMAVDADLNAGLIREDEARERRAHISREAEFHGAMDGASKFVRGDAIAALLITGINILGGVGTGLKDGLGVELALRKYAILTIGDGLVTQIPALLISTAAAILVVKSSSRASLSADLALELLGRPRVLLTVAVMVVALALAPGLPKLPFLAIALAVGGIQWARSGARVPAKAAGKDARPAVPASELPAIDQVKDLLNVDRLSLELGFALVPLADQARGGSVVERIAVLRKQIAGDSGWLVPSVRVKENLALQGGVYRVLLGGQEIATGKLMPGRYLAIGGSLVSGKLDGVATNEPSFGLPATWISEGDRALAELQGYTVIDPTTVLITHVGEVLKAQASELLTRDDVQALLDNLKKTAPAVVNELVPGVLSLGEVERVLAALVRERVSIRNLQAILEALADQAPRSKDTTALVESARQRVSRAVVAPHQDGEGRLFVLTLDPRVERRLQEGLLRPEGPAALDGAFLHSLVEGVAAEARRSGETPGRREPVLVVQGAVRARVAELLRQALPRVAVLSYAEIGGAKRVESVGVVKLVEAAHAPQV
jgi:flagellar biosynthesis protein FlhA